VPAAPAPAMSLGGLLAGLIVVLAIARLSLRRL
jgi:hypothetical protein